MHIFKEIEPLRAFLNQKRVSGSTIGIVPTMGALHKGHLSLVAASQAENDVTVCTIFVNPTQFNNPADLAKYPHMPEKDLSLLAGIDCDVAFLPEVSEIYSRPSELKLDFGQLDKVLEGEFRPGHFSGVGLVVAKLFNIVQPTTAYFGQKDYQQFAIITRLVEELSFGIQLRRIPTLREKDGLAMSSRNLRLTPGQREVAVVLNRSLEAAKAEIKRGISLTQVHNLVTSMFTGLTDVRLEYFVVADTQNLKPLNTVIDPKETILLMAAFVGEVRLIDNMIVEENS